MSQTHPLASRRRRLVALIYESLLLMAVLWATGALFQALLGMFGVTVVEISSTPIWRNLLGIYWLLTLYLYFYWCWARSGQTLSMKTWRLQLRTADDQLANWRAVAVRVSLGLLIYAPIAPAMVYAKHAPEMKWVLWASLVWAALPWLWTLIDRDKQLLHDRLAGLHIVLLPINRAD